MLGVGAPKSFRHQNLNLLPQEVVPLVPKQLLDLSIDQHDLALLIRDDHCIRSGFQKPAEFLLRFLPLADVRHSTHILEAARGMPGRESYNVEILNRTVWHQQTMLKIKTFPFVGCTVDNLP